MGSAKGDVLSLRVGNKLEDNLRELLERFPANNAGYFGTRSKRHSSNIRTIASDSPGRTASEFASIVGANPSVIHPISGKGFTWVLRDGGVVTYRWTSSSDGTPVVELTCNGVLGVANQKIHFVPMRKEKR